MEFSDISLRDAIIALAGLLGVYLVMTLLRLSQIKRKREALAGVAYGSTGYVGTRDEPQVDMVAFSATAAGIAAQLAAAIHPRDVVPESRLEPAFGTSYSSSEPGRDSGSLQAEVIALRKELTEARDLLENLQEEVARLSSRNSASPLYNEAMALASRGVDAAGIAGRCGISLGEAELVAALAQRPVSSARGLSNSKEEHP